MEASSELKKVGYEQASPVPGQQLFSVCASSGATDASALMKKLDSSSSARLLPAM